MPFHARSPANSPRPGLLASVRRLAASLAAALHTRIELLSKELERERVRITRLLIYGVAALFFISLGAIALTIFIIVLFWDTHRVLAAGCITAVYFALALGIALFAKREMARSTKPFASTIAQLKKDREQLSSR